MGFGGATPRPIHSAAIAAHAAREGMTDEEAELLELLLEDMDGVFFEHHRATSKQGSSA